MRLSATSRQVVAVLPGCQGAEVLGYRLHMRLLKSCQWGCASRFGYVIMPEHKGCTVV